MGHLPRLVSKLEAEETQIKKESSSIKRSNLSKNFVSATKQTDVRTKIATKLEGKTRYIKLQNKCKYKIVRSQVDKLIPRGDNLRNEQKESK